MSDTARILASFMLAHNIIRRGRDTSRLPTQIDIFMTLYCLTKTQPGYTHHSVTSRVKLPPRILTLLRKRYLSPHTHITKGFFEAAVEELLLKI